MITINCCYYNLCNKTFFPLFSEIKILAMRLSLMWINWLLLKIYFLPLFFLGLLLKYSRILKVISRAICLSAKCIKFMQNYNFFCTQTLFSKNNCLRFKHITVFFPLSFIGIIITSLAVLWINHLQLKENNFKFSNY